MKKYLLLFNALFILLITNAQTKLTYHSHSYRIGDQHEFILAQSVDEGEKGENITWDFSGLIATEKRLTSYMLDPVETDKGLMVKGVNVALKENNSVFFFKVDKSGINQLGTSSGESFSIMQKPFHKIKYPFTYSDLTTGEFTTTSEYNNNSTSTVNGIYSVEGDAWGKLILPNGTYEKALRVKQVRTFNNGSLKEIIFRWYSQSVRYPLLTIVKYENKGQTSLHQVAYYAHSKAIEPDAQDKSSMFDVYVSPNPFSQNIEVGYTLDNPSEVSIGLFDTNGTLVSALMPDIYKEAGNQKTSFNISPSITSGYYYIRVKIGTQSISKKIVKI